MSSTSAGGAGVRGHRSTAGRVVRWIALIVVVVLVAAIAYTAYSYQHFVSGVTHIDAIPTPSSSAAQNANQGENILLVGDDHRPAGATAAELAELGTTEDGGGDGGGARLLITTIQNLSGLQIDHFVRISMLGFYEVAKALGPIQVCLNEAVDDPYSTLDLPKGVSTLNAQQALAFVRQRHGLPLGDLDRVIRQQYFLSTESKNFLSPGTLLDPVKTENVLSAVSSAIQTDPGLNFLDLAMQFRSLTGGNLTSTTIPIVGTPTITVDGAPLDIVQVDPQAVHSFIDNLVSSSTSAYASAAAPVKSVTVTVLNGGSVDGAAAQNTQTLDAIGFKTGTPSDASTRSTTTIEYPPGEESQAKALAAYVPGASVEATSSVHAVTLVLGTDGLSVSRSSSGSSGESASSGTGSSASATPATPGSGDTAVTANGTRIPCID